MRRALTSPSVPEKEVEPPVRRALTHHVRPLEMERDLRWFRGIHDCTPYWKLQQSDTPIIAEVRNTFIDVSMQVRPRQRRLSV
jgi:hypothetical protein